MKKCPKSKKIFVTTSNDHSHPGYQRICGRTVIYERREEVEDPLARHNYYIPHERRNGFKPLKADMFFSSQEYGEAISRAWNFLKANRNKTVKRNQKVIDTIFKSFQKLT
jgi:hypothetical protein